MKKTLSSLFLTAALSGCASIDELRDRYVYGFNAPSGYAIPGRGSSPYSPESLNFGIKRRGLTTEELLQTRPKPRVEKDVIIVDFQRSSKEIQEACTQSNFIPVMRQGGSDMRTQQAVLIYDIDEKGQIINTEIDLNKTKQGSDISFSALQGLRKTKFLPPVFNNHRLYCRNVTDMLSWYTEYWENFSIRTIGPQVKKLGL